MKKRKKSLSETDGTGLKKVGRVKISMKIVGELLGAKLMVFQNISLSSLAFADIWRDMED